MGLPIGFITSSIHPGGNFCPLATFLSNLPSNPTSSNGSSQAVTLKLLSLSIVLLIPSQHSYSLQLLPLEPLLRKIHLKEHHHHLHYRDKLVPSNHLNQFCFLSNSHSNPPQANHTNHQLQKCHSHPQIPFASLLGVPS